MYVQQSLYTCSMPINFNKTSYLSIVSSLLKVVISWLKIYDNISYNDLTLEVVVSTCLIRDGNIF